MIFRFLAVWSLFGIHAIAWSMTSDQPNAWCILAAKDLDNAYHLIQENHPGIIDKQNPAFKQLCEQSYQKAKKSLGNVTSFEGYQFLLRHFASMLQDTHLWIWFNIEKKEVSWPGFLINYRDGKFFVAQKSTDSFFSDIPPEGTELVLCNGIAVKDFFVKNIMPYFLGINTLEAHWALRAPLLTIDFSNPLADTLRTCTFRINKQLKTISLPWQSIDYAFIKEKINTILFEQQPRTFGITYFSKNGAWISLPSFDPKDEEAIKALKDILEEAKNINNKDIIVFDLRGNEGGYSSWGWQLLDILFGASYMQQIDDADKTYTEWRISQFNKENLQKMAQEIKKQFGQTAEQYVSLQKLIRAMQKRLPQEGYVSLPQTMQPAMPILKKPLPANIFLVTDYFVRSAALDFVDVLLKIPGVIHVGLPTNADSLYSGSASQLLPSGTAILDLPTNVIRNRDRGNNQSYMPLYRYEGNMNDTTALQKWIINLAKKI